MRTLCVLLVAAMLSACSATMLQYDAVTADQIKRTIEHEKRAQAFVQGKLSATDELEFDVVSDAEVARLGAWLAAEEAKKLEDQ